MTKALNKALCSGCGLSFQVYWLKDGKCNGCRNPEAIVSSIVTKYGDLDRVKEDAKTLNEILSRQGASLLIDVIGDHCGETVNKFRLGDADRVRLRDSLVTELKESINERT